LGTLPEGSNVARTGTATRRVVLIAFLLYLAAPVLAQETIQKDSADVQVPEGYRLEVFTAGLNYVSDITEANARLTYHGGLDATSIQVKVEGGEITLGGTVDNRRTTRLAEDALERVSGVKGTHNQLRQQAQDKA
jgi:hypothetical protein